MTGFGFSQIAVAQGPRPPGGRGPEALVTRSANSSFLAKWPISTICRLAAMVLC